VDFIICRLSRMEMDKIVEQVALNGCEVYGNLTSGGAGVLDAPVKDTSIYGFVRATPRRSWVFDECRAYDGVMMSKGLNHTPFALTSAAGEASRPWKSRSARRSSAVTINDVMMKRGLSGFTGGWANVGPRARQGERTGRCSSDDHVSTDAGCAQRQSNVTVEGAALRPPTHS
jgi:hypothetical protein